MNNQDENMTSENEIAATGDDACGMRPRRGDGHGRRGGPGGMRGGRRGGHDREMRRGRGRRALAHGDLRLLILSIINKAPSHGYGLIAEIKTLTSGSYEPSPGVIYPALEALQDLGWVDVQPDKGKRVLHITDAGQAELKEQSSAVELIEKRLEGLASRSQGVEPDDVRGAMRQLKFTTISVVKAPAAKSETREQVVKILEDARKKIEGLG